MCGAVFCVCGDSRASLLKSLCVCVSEFKFMLLVVGGHISSTNVIVVVTTVFLLSISLSLLLLPRLNSAKKRFVFAI